MDRQQARLETFNLSEMGEAPGDVGGETEAYGLRVSGRARPRLCARLLSPLIAHGHAFTLCLQLSSWGF